MLKPSPRPLLFAHAVALVSCHARAAGQAAASLVDFSLAHIERIEVISGPGATIWGANAVNGAINIITRAAAGTEGGLPVAGGGRIENGRAVLVKLALRF